jgi:hypothetical protein
MTTAQEAMKAISWRLMIHDELRGEAGVFCQPLRYVKNSRCLMLKTLPIPRKNCVLSAVYSRESTRTYVNRLSSPDHSVPVIVKAFGIRGSSGSPDCLLSEHEVEVRHLLLMTALMRSGLTDASTIPLGLGITTREGLKNSGLLLSEQAEKMFPESTKTQNAPMYAIILAEAADASLTDFLWHGNNSSATAHLTDYRTRAALLMVSLALSTLHSIFPSFRHNDLHASNVLVQCVDPLLIRKTLGSHLPDNYPLLVEYDFAGRKWQVDIEKAPFRCLLWDFSFASIEERDGGRAGVDCVAPREARFGSLVQLSKTAPNQYCDMHKIFDTLRWVLTQGKGHGWKRLTDITQQQINAVAPLDLSYVGNGPTDQQKRGRQIKVHNELQHTSPTQALIYDNLFSDFRVDQIPATKRKRPVYSVQGQTQGPLDPRSLMTWPVLHTPGNFLPREI